MVNLRYQTIEGIIEALKDLERKGIKLEDRIDLQEASNKILQENGVKETIDVLPKLIDKLEEIQGQQKETKVEVKREIEMKELEKAKALSKADLEDLLRDLDESEKQAVEEAISNDPNTTKEQIEQFIKRQQEIKQEALRREEIETKIKQQTTEIAEKLVKEENILKRKEEIESLKIKAEKYIDGEHIETKSTLEREFIGETKKLVLQNNKEITELKRGYLREKIEKALIKPGANLKEREAVSKYANLVSKTLHSDSKRSIEMYKSEAVASAEAKKINVGAVENGWNNFKALNVLMESPVPIKELAKQYDEVKIKDIPADLPQCRALDEAFASVKELPKLNQLVSLYQTFTGNSGSLWWKVAEKVGLDKVLINASEKILGASGGEFTKNALVIFANRPSNEASVIVMQNYLSGGANAVAVAAATILVENAGIAVAAATGALTNIGVAAELLINEAFLTVSNNFVVATLAQNTAAIKVATEALKTMGISAELLAGEKLGPMLAQFMDATLTRAELKVALAKLVAETGVKSATTVTFGASLMAGIKTALGPVGWIVTAGMILLKPIFDKITEGFKSVFGNTLGGLMGFGAQVGASLWGMAKTSALFGKLGGILGLGGKAVVATTTTTAGAGLAAGGTAAAATVGWPVIAVIAGIILIFVFGISFSSMASSLVPPEGAQDLEEYMEETAGIEYEGVPVKYGNYTGAEGPFLRNGVEMYVFEKDTGGGRLGQKYDIGAEDGGVWLEGVPEQYRAVKNQGEIEKYKLDKRVIPAYTAMVQAAWDDGISKEKLKLNSGYRSLTRQQELWEDEVEKFIKIIQAGKCPHEEKPKACSEICSSTSLSTQQKAEECADKWVATSGNSPHHTGRALDIVWNNASYQWLNENASKFGFYNYKLEEWHWEYNPKE